MHAERPITRLETTRELQRELYLAAKRSRAEIGLGGIPIIPLPREEAVSVVKHCFDLGITFFDTANMYPTSEEKIGLALKSVRREVVIATKTTQRDAKGAADHLDLSLRQLQTDWIDVYQLHNVSNEEALHQVLAPQGAYEAVAKARDVGKIRVIGISSHSMATAMEALKTGLFQTLQFPFNFIESDPADELFPLATQKKVGIIGMKPLGGGVLERADLCFKFLQQHPYVTPIPGIRAKKEVDEIVELYRKAEPLSADDLKEIENIRSTLGAAWGWHETTGAQGGSGRSGENRRRGGILPAFVEGA